MIEANKYKLGIFVIIGTILFFGALFALGLRDLFQSKVKFGTLFDESVQGLEVGTAVKLRGVIVGKVSQITLRPEDNYVWVQMEALPSSIDPAKQSLGILPSERARFFFDVLGDEVKKGLRCRLAIASIATGMKFVELDYYDPNKNPPLNAEVPPNVFYVPSTPSLLSGLSSNISETLAKIAAVDYQKLSTEVIQTFKSVNVLLENPKIDKLITKLEETGNHIESATSNFNKALTEDKIKGMTEQFETTLKSIDELSKTLKKEVEDANLPRLASNTDKTVGEAGKAAESLTEMKKDINNTLDKLDQAIDAFTELVKYLEEDPSSVVRGKQKQE